MTRKCKDCGKQKDLEAGFYKNSYQPVNSVTYMLNCKKCVGDSNSARRVARKAALKVVPVRKPYEESLAVRFARIDSLIASKRVG